uniref:Uncharacterized protein n=1 Tax=Timema shepardi TaxID=629360 RepID=A0A7R9AZ70_TIMSH|nr:unnamed protein product [Timema shepardi]
MDVEELSARLSLMSPGGTTEQQDSSAVAAEGYNTNQCIYLEQLLGKSSVANCTIWILLVLIPSLYNVRSNIGISI